jgi:hypothetical protein
MKDERKKQETQRSKGREERKEIFDAVSPLLAPLRPGAFAFQFLAPSVSRSDWNPKKKEGSSPVGLLPMMEPRLLARIIRL